MTSFSTDRSKVAALRGLLYSIKFAIEEKDSAELEGMLPEIVQMLDATADGPNFELRGEHRPGYVFTGLDYVKVVPGSKWRYTANEESYDVTLIGRGKDGDVHLRPEPALVKRLNDWYPPSAFDKKNPSQCPFYRVDAKAAKRGAQDGLQEGDLLCHEAWGVWLDLMPLSGA